MVDTVRYEGFPTRNLSTYANRSTYRVGQLMRPTYIFDGNI